MVTMTTTIQFLKGPQNGEFKMAQMVTENDLNFHLNLSDAFVWQSLQCSNMVQNILCCLALLFCRLVGYFDESKKSIREWKGSLALPPLRISKFDENTVRRIIRRVNLVSVHFVISSDRPPRSQSKVPERDRRPTTTGCDEPTVILASVTSRAGCQIGLHDVNWVIFHDVGSVDYWELDMWGYFANHCVTK